MNGVREICVIIYIQQRPCKEIKDKFDEKEEYKNKE